MLFCVVRRIVYFGRTKFNVMKRIFFSVLFISLGYVSFAQEGATITFDTLVIDYGNINKGDDGVRQFRFTNTGTSSTYTNSLPIKSSV